MKIELRQVSLRDVHNGYLDSGTDGVVAFGGKLDVRPKYQREYVYKDDKRDAVIDTVRKGFPLNVMYWVVTGDDTYEVLDGQQRTISLCQYVSNDFSVNIDGRPMTFQNLTQEVREQILDYELMVYFCTGTDQEKLDWFRTINIAGEKLTDQELRNAVYTGSWLTHAKSIFSKPNCAAYLLAKDYTKGVPIRQELLQTALKWKSEGKIDAYMSAHQGDPNANELWTYFQGVINWVKLTFPKRRKEMKDVDWGSLYDAYGDELLDTEELEGRVRVLMMDEDVTNKKGVYAYVLTGEEKHLSIRAFTDAQKRQAYEAQDGVCKKCPKKCELSEMQGDHITPWSKGGKTIAENCAMLCADCNRRKSGA